MKSDISNRADVELLVETFYGEIRKHEVLGPIFNTVIQDWPAHLTQLSDFWESTLFQVQKFKGQPMRAHLEVDARFNHSIEQAHFGHWLELWFRTLDQLFEGEMVVLAKERARNVAHMTFMRLHQARQGKLIR